MNPIVRNKNNDFLYEYLGDNVFQNICTGVSGKVSDEAAQKTFAINLDATEMIADNPIVKEFISKLNLKMDTSVRGL